MANCFEQKVLATMETFEPTDCIKIVIELDRALHVEPTGTS